MYYHFEEIVPDYPENVSYDADREYSREISALFYAEKVGLAGGFVLKYYSSWIFNLGVSGSQTIRSVYLILYEQIRGTSLYNLYRRYRKGNEEYFNTFYFSEKYRLKVFVLLLDG